jgi:hypothetical protein
MDNRGHILACLMGYPVNIHDTLLFPWSFESLLTMSDALRLALHGSYLTLDSGFDSRVNKVLIEYHNLIPVIKPNRRGTKSREKIYRQLDEFNEHIYKTRFAVERTFAWQDTYRRLVMRYERKQIFHLGFKYLAYSLINLREFLQ